VYASSFEMWEGCGSVIVVADVRRESIVERSDVKSEGCWL